MTCSIVRSHTPSWLWQVGWFTRWVVLFVRRPHACCQEGFDDGEGWKVTVNVTLCRAAEQWQIEAGRAGLTDGQAWTLGRRELRSVSNPWFCNETWCKAKCSWFYCWMLLRDEYKIVFQTNWWETASCGLAPLVFRILSPSLVEARSGAGVCAARSAFQI